MLPFIPSTYLLVLVSLVLGDAAVGGVHVVLEELVLAEGGGAHGALVGEVRRLQRLAVVLRHVVEQLPLVDLHDGWCERGRAGSG